MSDLVLRRATPADLDAIAAIHEAAARAGYRNVFPPTAPFPREDARRELASHLADDAMGVTLALRSGAATGFIAAGTCDDPTLDDAGQIHLLHVHPDSWGGGIGTLLHAAALAELARAGYRRAVLWVLVENDRARGFYERRGWIADGARRSEQHAVTVRIMRYARAL